MPKSTKRVLMNFKYLPTISNYIYLLLCYFTPNVSRFFLEMSLPLPNLPKACARFPAFDNQFLCRCER